MLNSSHAFDFFLITIDGTVRCSTLNLIKAEMCNTVIFWVKNLKKKIDVKDLFLHNPKLAVIRSLLIKSSVEIFKK